MSFLDSEFLYLMLPPFFIFIYFVLKNTDTLKSYFDEEILKKIVIAGDMLGNRGRNISLLLALFYMIVALARPISDAREVEIEAGKSNLIVALDISRSMLVSDVYPNRLDFAKNRLLWLMDALPNTNIGLVAFAKDAFLVSPATLDKRSLAFLLDNLTPDIVSRQGTDITNALMQVDVLFEKKERVKRVLVLSDGGSDKDIQKAIQIAQNKNLQVSVMIIGTEKGGVIKDTQGLLKDMDGNIVISKRNDSMMELSEATKGVFIQEFGEGNGIKLLKKALFEDAKNVKAEKKTIFSKKEWFMIPLLFSLFFIVVALHGLPRRKGTQMFVALVLVVSSGDTLYAGVMDFYHIDKANKAIKDKAYDEALKSYEKLENLPELRYNKGNLYYKKEEYRQAIKEFKSVKTKNQDLSFKTHYNLGNSYVKNKQLNEALESYQSALKLNPKDKDTIENIKYVKKRLKQKKKDKQKKNDTKMQNKNKKNKNSKSNSDNKAKNESQQGQNKNKKEDKKESKEKQKAANQEKQQGGSGKSGKSGSDNKKRFSMSENEAQKWENQLTEFRPMTKPMRLGKKSQYKGGEDIKNAW